MPSIFELLGYPSLNRSAEIETSRRTRLCPFTGSECDGGGNRSQSAIRLDREQHRDLRDYFGNAESVQAGVCSIQKNPNEDPWIVCPNRLVYFGAGAWSAKAGNSAREAVIECCGLPRGAHIGVWRELSIKYKREMPERHVVGEFDYRFDYVLMPLATVRFEDALQDSDLSSKEFSSLINRDGYSTIIRRGERYIEDYPQGAPTVIELMACSTSGGNKRKRTQVSQAFEDCLLRGDHCAPGINQRQVLGRMITQLLVKSQASLHWGGRTIWVLQDSLARYISASTALDLEKLSSSRISEVNLLSLKYGRPREDGAIDLAKAGLFSDLIHDDGGENPSFKDVLLGSVFPPRAALIDKLLATRMCDNFICP